MCRMAALYFVILLANGCSPTDRSEVDSHALAETRIVDGLGEFSLGEDEMWEGTTDVHAVPVKVFLHAYETDFEILAAYAKRILLRRPLPDESMLDDVRRGMENQAWKFKEYHFDPGRIELQNFRVERLVIGKDFDGPDIEAGINLKYPGDVNQWHLDYFRESERGSLNWIPQTE